MQAAEAGSVPLKCGQSYVCSLGLGLTKAVKDEIEFVQSGTRPICKQQQRCATHDPTKLINLSLSNNSMKLYYESRPAAVY